ncbi:MAG: hypothetical protein HYY08_00240 [Firmicutes bacterium]|nr:hypothetical protein [Bacillota bacterium]
MGVAAILGTYAAGLSGVSRGLLVGMPVGLFNHFLISAGFRKGLGLSPRKAVNVIFARSLLRMAISAGVLVASATVGVDFMLGALAGLLLEMFTQAASSLRLLSLRGAGPG